MAGYIILCEEDLKRILDPHHVSVPQADPHPIVAGDVLGVYADAKTAERALLGFPCPAKHWIVRAVHFKRLNLEGL